MSSLTNFFASSVVGLAALSALPFAPQDGLQESANAVVQATWKSGGWEAGAVVVAVGDEAIFSAGHGTSAADAKRKVTSAASLGAAPMAHPFLSALALQSCSRGDLDLDDRLGSLIPELVGEDCEVHVRHLLNHTSGFVDCFAADPLEDAPQGSLWKRMQRVVKEPLVTSPGECVAPTTTDALLIAAVLEQLDELPIETILQQRLFDKLGMQATRCVDDGDKSAVREASDPQGRESAGFDPRCLETSAEDLVRFQRALIDYELFGEDQYLEMTAPTRLNDGTRSAFGMGLRQISVAEVRGWRGGGVDEEVSTVFAYFPEYELSIAVIGRGDRVDTESLVDELAMLVIAPPEPEIADILLKADAMAPYLGTYQIGCTSLIIRAGEGRLILDDAVTGELILLNQGDHYFIVESDPGMRLTFELGEDHAESFVLDDHGVEAVATRFD